MEGNNPFSSSKKIKYQILSDLCMISSESMPIEQTGAPYNNIG